MSRHVLRNLTEGSSGEKVFNELFYEPHQENDRPIDEALSRYPEAVGRKVNVIGVYIAWRGKDVTLAVAKFLTFWNRKSTGGQIAAANGCLAAISELALAARAPDKTFHHCLLLGHSFGELVLEKTLSHSILDVSGTGARNTSPWDMAVLFNPADSAVTTRQLIAELDHLYRYDPARHGYVERTPGSGRPAS